MDAVAKRVICRLNGPQAILDADLDITEDKGMV
jgi:hypothetical protein